MHTVETLTTGTIITAETATTEIHMHQDMIHMQNTGNLQAIMLHLMKHLRQKGI